MWPATGWCGLCPDLCVNVHCRVALPHVDAVCRPNSVPLDGGGCLEAGDHMPAHGMTVLPALFKKGQLLLCSLDMTQDDARDQ